MPSKRKKRGAVKMSKPEIQAPTELYLESNVRFSFRDCEVGTKYCILQVNKSDLQKLYRRLGHIEDLTWRQFSFLSREKQLTYEKKDSESYQMLKAKYSHFDHFGHFRVDGTDTVFRVFAAKRGVMLYVLLIDSKGTIHH